MRQILCFGPAQAQSDGRSLREVEFRKISTLPLDTACSVAQALREQFGGKLAQGKTVDVFEPIALTSNVLEGILPGSMVFLAEATAGRFWLILRRESVFALLTAAFGDIVLRPQASLSPLERQSLQAMVQEIALLCAPLAGELLSLHLTHDYAALAEADSYFEVRMNLAQPLSLGVIVACDPPEPTGEYCVLEELAHVPIPVRVVAGHCELTLAQLAALHIGDILPMIRGENAQLMTGSVSFAHGTCGIANGHNALLIGTSGESSIS